MLKGPLKRRRFNDLVIGTYGRGFWILDDITPLQQTTPEIIESDVHLFSPRDAYRFISTETHGTLSYIQPGDQTKGENPPYGASINYYLKTPSDDEENEDEAEIEISILDTDGQTIRTLEGTKEQGINRIWWDLRYEDSPEIKLRTSPVGNPHIVVGP